MHDGNSPLQGHSAEWGNASGAKKTWAAVLLRDPPFANFAMLSRPRPADTGGILSPTGLDRVLDQALCYTLKPRRP
ncbi:hypothetical protein [Streptomyces sp. NPDC060022]|uniref:hypothetical protein n=1 Tax=Streptomyces sp. NPDC060022 TaxID=3347039 RepID=UPI0036872EA7